MAAAAASQPAPQNLPLLVAKLYDADSDIRFMSLTDLQTIFQSSQSSTILSQDYNTCAKTVDGLIHTLGDSNGEVQNLTVQCLGPFVNRAHERILCPFIDRVSAIDLSHSTDQSIRALAIRAIVIALPRPSSGSLRTKEIHNAYEAISRVLIPRLVGYNIYQPQEKGLPPVPKGLLIEDMETNADHNNIDVLTEVARCFGPMLRPEEVQALQKILLEILEEDRISGGLKKKAVLALSVLANFFSDTTMSAVISHIIERMKLPHITFANRKLYINILASMARSIPAKFGPHLLTLAPFILTALSQEELDEQMDTADDEDGRDPQEDEVREAAMIALESFLASCSNDMQRYLDDCSDATLRFLKYDPNIADSGYNSPANDDDLEEDDEFEMDADFEEEADGDDEDDVSWKLRRCAARTLHTMLSVRGSELLDNGTLLDAILRALIGRFDEREEVVRIEVLTTLGFLITKIGLHETQSQINPSTFDGSDAYSPSQTPSRKRRRGVSDVSMSEPLKVSRLTGSMSPESRSPPRSGPPANLAQLSPEIYRGLLKLLKSSSPATKQAVIGVLKDLIVARRGNATEHLSILVGPVTENINSSEPTLAVGSTSLSTIQLLALQLTSEITRSHSSSSLKEHLPQILPAVIKATHNKNPNISCEALSTLEQLVKVVTPPRNASSNVHSIAQLEQMYQVVIDLVSSKVADLSVRQQAIGVLGTLVGRTLGKGEKLLAEGRRAQAFDQLFEASKNETTRFASIKAIQAVAEQAPNGAKFKSKWFCDTCTELGSQLRKADRSIRLISLSALRSLIVRHPGTHNLDRHTGQQLSSSALQPLLNFEDLSMLGSVLVIFTSMIPAGSCVVDKDLVANLCLLLKGSTAVSVLDTLCDLVNAIGKAGLGKQLMQSLLTEVGVAGPPSVVGKVIGNLLVSGGSDLGVSTNDFFRELKSTADDKRRSLALSILGETGLRSGSQANLSPDLFMGYFDQDSSDVPLNAAIALGRASAGPGNLQSWVPSVLSKLRQHPNWNYLVLHAIKELLQYNENDDDIVPFISQLWDASIDVSRAEENKTIGAECVANLTLVAPRKYMPILHSLLSNDSTAIRRTAIVAFRDVFTIADQTYDKELRPIIVDVLTTMMRDSEVENRRSSLNSFNAAVRNKAALVFPQMGQLLPLVIDQTLKDPSLMREVPMGPFKHTVDDGLEVRKNAYETVYSLVENATDRVDIPKVYDRIVEGITDDRGIQTLCNLLITKLAVLVPDETARRLDSIAEQFSRILAFKPKENSVRHEFEKADEAKKGVMKVALELVKLFPGESTSKTQWANFLDEMKKASDGTLLREVEKELREANRT